MTCRTRDYGIVAIERTGFADFGEFGGTAPPRVFHLEERGRDERWPRDVEHRNAVRSVAEAPRGSLDRAIQGRGKFARATSIPADGARAADFAGGSGAVEASDENGEPAHDAEGDVRNGHAEPLLVVPVSRRAPDGIRRRDERSTERKAERHWEARSARAMDIEWARNWRAIEGSGARARAGRDGFVFLGRVSDQEDSHAN